jgi:parallel beta-helix repeat protein
MKKLTIVALLVMVLFSYFMADFVSATPVLVSSTGQRAGANTPSLVGPADANSTTPETTLLHAATYRTFLPLIVKDHLSCDHIIGHGIAVADARSGYSDVRPGDTVCLAPGKRGDLALRNFQGTPDNPITFTNFGGQVVIDSDTSHGILFQNCRFFRLTGSGAYDIAYGIRIVDSAGTGVRIGYKSSNFEIDHVEVSGVGGAGISAKSKALCPDGSTNDYDYDADGKILGDLDDVVNRDNFTEHDFVFHDNYIHDVGSEGFYVGSSFYQEGRGLSCDSGPETAYDPVIKGVDVYDNIVANTGWDGVQVGSAVEKCNIHHNMIIGDSQADRSEQQSGVMNNPGSVCHIYSNLIKDGGGPGIYVQGNGGNVIYNNVIVDAGHDESVGNNGGDGIAVMPGSNPGNSIYVLNNTVVAPRNFGIKFPSDQGTDNRILNNIIVAPGNYDSYGEDAYIQTWGQENATISNNLTSQTLAEVRFVSPASHDYSIEAGSPAVDSGIDWGLGMSTRDYAGVRRPQGAGYDIGAYEFVP